MFMLKLRFANVRTLLGFICVGQGCVSFDGTLIIIGNVSDRNNVLKLTELSTLGEYRNGPETIFVIFNIVKYFS